MEEQVFKSGDLVMLKSGGPVMTISFVNQEFQTADCMWFTNDEVNEHTFPVASLKPSTLEA